ncbi:MAG: FAD:protein FMN transferase, partial [Parasporobacterium sp.]|nr:FAD:protein FMN transferase [Parasporobacterium sp.]
MCSLLLSACSSKNAEPISQTHFYFDSTVTFTVYDQSDVAALDRCRDICEQVHNMTDRFNTESELSAINKEKNALLSEDMSALLANINKYSEGTGFTPCIAPFMDLWGFSTDNPKVPSEEDIRNLLIKNYGFTLSDDNKSV